MDKGQKSANAYKVSNWRCPKSCIIAQGLEYALTSPHEPPHSGNPAFPICHGARRSRRGPVGHRQLCTDAAGRRGRGRSSAPPLPAGAPFRRPLRTGKQWRRRIRRGLGARAGRSGRRVYSLTDVGVLKGDAARAQIACGLPVAALDAFLPCSGDVVIDGLFGAGLTRDVPQLAVQAIAAIEAAVFRFWRSIFLGH